MNLKTTETNGKHFATVSKGDTILFRTHGYYTAGMALADAQCWAAFHGEVETMNSLVSPGEEFKARRKGDHAWTIVTNAEMLRKLEEAERFGLEVTVKKATDGGEYIEIGRNGCSYGQYHRMGRPALGDLSVMLTPDYVETKTRPEFYGTPAYFGKVEWFMVVDRKTNMPLPFSVSRVDGKEVIVNGRGGVTPGLSSLNAAAEFIHAGRMF